MSSHLEHIVLVRHATSLANLDPTLYKTLPDHAIPLVRPDDDPAAISAAQAIRDLAFPVQDTCVWISTYLRCKQTEGIVTRHLFGTEADELRRRESFLLREQEFGDWDGLNEDEMAAHHPDLYDKRRRLTDTQGRFYFRYPNGESRADVVQRVSVFLGKVHRSKYHHHIIFLHGVTQRSFRMAWFDRPPEWFENEPNPRNASVLLIDRDQRGWWQERYLVP